jgi:hypothetical protein
MIGTFPQAVWLRTTKQPFVADGSKAYFQPSQCVFGIAPKVAQTEKRGVRMKATIELMTDYQIQNFVRRMVVVNEWKGAG